MSTEVKVPSLGMDMEEATIVRWLVEEGTEINKGDPLLEIDSDKATFEVEATAPGTLKRPRGGEGEVFAVGAILAYITDPDEEPPEEAASDVTAAGDETATETSGPPRETNPEVEHMPQLQEAGGKRASPAARLEARRRDLDIEAIEGSGPGNRVYLSDVLAASQEAIDGTSKALSEQDEPQPVGQAAEAVHESNAPAEEPSVSENGSRREPLSRVRKLGATRTAASFSEVPHFYLHRELVVDRVLDLRERLKSKLDPAPSITDLLNFAVGRTLPDHPRLNGRFAGDEVELFEGVNLGLAVATDQGLVVPIVKEAQTISLQRLSAASRELVEKAREGKLRREDVSGGTFTVSNLGMMGVDDFNAVINAPEAAILALGRVRTIPEWDGESWIPKRVISATLSVDHRIADGADGAGFLEALQRVLDDWELLL